MSTVTRVPLLPVQVPRSVRRELLEIVRSAHLSTSSEHAILKALSGPTRVLPEGKPGLCAALTFLSYSSVAKEESLNVVPAVAAMEMLVAAGDVIDDIQDGESDLTADRHALGQVLETVSLLLMSCHSAIASLADRGVPHSRVFRGLRVLNSQGVSAMRGQSLDITFETRRDVSLKDSLDISRLKSASLTRCAAELGASVGTDDDDDIHLCAQFGLHFGLFLQLINDVAAVWPGASDKSDIRLRKKTLPVVFALSLPQKCSRHADEVRQY